MNVLFAGASNQIGAYLIPQLLAEGHAVIAVSRRPQPAWIGDHPALRWLQHDLVSPLEMPEVDAMIQAGPLALAAQVFANNPNISCVLAFSTTSVLTKAQSSDSKEREQIRAIAEAEATLMSAATARGADCVICRPTIIYGAGLDQGLTQVAQMLERLPVFPLPFGGTGLRQPVHAQDLAIMASRWIASSDRSTGIYATPGGQALTYRQMVKKIRDSINANALIVSVPGWLARAALATCQAMGRMQSTRSAMLNRISQDLVFDGAPAAQDLGFQPRPFEPDAACWQRPSAPFSIAGVSQRR